MAKNVGTLIREARTAAGLSQAELAKRAGNLTSTDISKAERGEKSLTQAQLKQIAKATGVAQTTLLNAPKGGVSSAGSSASGSSSSGKTASSTLKLSKTEKELILLYRAANDETKKHVVELLTPKDAGNDLANALISALGGNAGGNGGSDLLGSLLGGSSSGNSGNAGGSLLGSLLGGGSSGNSAGGDLLGALLNATSTNTADDDDSDNNQGGGLLGGLLNLLSGK
jgi:transcriptional regulator with XRE-family HTH domain